MSKLELRFLGNYKIKVDNKPFPDLTSQKAIALLCYLAVTGQQHERLHLATLLWGDTPEDNARMNLRKTVAALRNTVGEFLIINNRKLAFDVDSSYWLDVAELEGVVKQAKSGQAINLELLSRLKAIAVLYKGDFLQNLYIRNAPLFDEWVMVQQARFREYALEILHTLSDYYSKLEQFEEALGYSRRLLQLEPWREETHRQIMHLLANNGNRTEAIIQYEICRRTLEEEFGIKPSYETTLLYEQLRDEQLPIITNDSSQDKLIASAQTKGSIPKFLSDLVNGKKFYNKNEAISRLLTGVAKSI